MAKTKMKTIQKFIGNYSELEECILNDIFEVDFPEGFHEELARKAKNNEIDSWTFAKESDTMRLRMLRSNYEWELSELEYKCIRGKLNLFEFHTARVRIRLLERLLNYIPHYLDQQETSPIEFSHSQKFYALQKLGLFEFGQPLGKISVQKDKAKLLGLILGSDYSIFEKLFANPISENAKIKPAGYGIVDRYFETITSK